MPYYPPPDAPAAGSVVDASVSASAAIAISKLADPTTGKVVGSTSSAAAAVFPPGYLIGSASAGTSNIVLSGTEATPTAIATLGAITYDGTACWLEFYATSLTMGTSVGAICGISLWDTTDLGRVFRCVTPSANAMTVSVYFRIPITPSAGSHTYQVQGWSTTANATLVSGAFGSGNAHAAFLSMTKA
jgi:hypothetical protein